jgi:hypothetical protein
MTSILSSGVVEVAVCLAFVYLLLSLLCSVVNEWIAGILGSRAQNLENGIQSMFTDGKLNAQTSLTDAIYSHGLIQSLYQQGFWDRFFRRRGGPSYIAPELFATTLVNLLMPTENEAANSVDALRQAIASLPDSKGKQALAALVNQGQTKLEDVRKTLENWYNDGMDRVAGWYKRKTTVVLFVLGLLTAVCTNTDSFLVARVLWNNPALREATVTAADNYVQNQTKPAPGTATAQDVKSAVASLNSQLETLQLPVGWPSVQAASISQPLAQTSTPDPRKFPDNTPDALFRIFGWLFTAAALSLGAPFWFDVLNKFMVVRSTVKPKEKSQPEASKD